MKIKKSNVIKEVDQINKLVKSVNDDNKIIDYVNNTLIMSGGEVIDKKNFSIMSLPSTKDILKNL